MCLYVCARARAQFIYTRLNNKLYPMFLQTKHRRSYIITQRGCFFFKRRIKYFCYANNVVRELVSANHTKAFTYVGFLLERITLLYETIGLHIQPSVYTWILLFLYNCEQKQLAWFYIESLHIPAQTTENVLLYKASSLVVVIHAPSSLESITHRQNVPSVVAITVLGVLHALHLYVLMQDI